MSTTEPGSLRRWGNLSEVLRTDVPVHSNARLYVAGPPAMVDSVVAAAQECGFTPDRIHADPFHHSAESAAPSRIGLGGVVQGLKSLLGVSRVSREAKS